MNGFLEKERAMLKQSGTFQTFDGLELFFRHTRPENPKASVVVVHGLGEHSGRYKWLEEFLCDHDLSFCSFDQRGHGRSAGSRVYVEHFTEYIEDLKSFIQLVHSREEGPVYLFGHSMGTIVASLYAIRYSEGFSGLILSSSPFLPHTSFLAPKMLMGKILSLFLPGFRIPSGLDGQWLSHDPEVLRNYDSDPLVERKITLQWGISFGRALEDAKQSSSQLKSPLLMLHGEEDRIADIKGAQSFFQHAGSADKSFVSYPRLFHELHNESRDDRTKIFEDLFAWISKRA